MISRIGVRLRWLRRKMSRVRWAARLAGIPLAEGRAQQRGLILIQIDGLSYEQFQRALKGKRLKFLEGMIKREALHPHHFYSGVPSTTPAVQGEIFYGVRAAVPAFQFLHKPTGKIFRMSTAEAAETIEKELKEKCGRPLLQDGHAYSDIYRAGAAGSWYCSADLKPSRMWRRATPLAWIVLSVAYSVKIARFIGLALLELLLALVDCVRGIFARQNLIRELIFVPARVFICILLREYIRFRMLLDIEKGVRVIHANFLGYDEQAHRRGPDSAFAHWTLKGIDRAIRDIERAAVRSEYRDYELIVYSDHGQEKTTPYETATGREFDVAVREVFSDGPLAEFPVRLPGGPQKVAGKAGRPRIVTEKMGDDEIVIAAMGPLGHLYLPRPLEAEWLGRYATALVEKAAVPMVIWKDGEIVRATTADGVWVLPRDAEQLLGRGHPFPRDAAEDLAALADHRDAGQLIASGWRPHGRPVSFPSENGAHAGPGRHETHGFLLLPDLLEHEAAIRKEDRPIRPEDLHRLAIGFLDEDRPIARPARPRREGVRKLRVMTYNIHSCVGIDGRLRPERIARAINRYHPDIVAVQEVDAHRMRSGHFHQAELIATHLDFHHVFHSMLDEDEKYGIAIFSALPFETVKSGLLTSADPGRKREARGAIHIKVDLGDHQAHFLNTHFGLAPDERNRQAGVLLEEEWLGGIPENEPAILCGDFNSTRSSVAWRRLNERLPDVRLAAPGIRKLATFPSIRPIAELDHIFASRHFRPTEMWAARAHSVMMASDHLPLIVDLEMEVER